MKCKNCGKKVFRDVLHEGWKTGWRMCVNCKTLHNFRLDYLQKLEESKEKGNEIRKNKNI